MATTAQAFIADFDHEAAGTRRLLERVPEDRLDWRPHPKSTPLGRLAEHVATLPGMAAGVMGSDSLDIGSTPRREPLRTRADLLAAFDANVGVVHGALDGATDDRLAQPWSLRNGGQTLFSLPRIEVLRRFMLHHSIHHRAQLGVYLRLNDVPLPGVYGPSADEG